MVMTLFVLQVYHSVGFAKFKLVRPTELNDQNISYFEAVTIGQLPDSPEIIREYQNR